MPLVIHEDRIPIRLTEEGAARVGETRVTLEIVLNDFKDGLSAEEIQRHYPTLRLADVYAVIAYYLRHQPEMDVWLAHAEAQSEGQRKQVEEVQPNNAEFRDQIQARWNAMRSADAQIPR